MSRLVITLHLMALTLEGRTRQRVTELKTDRDRGSVTLEQVIVTAGLALLAIAVIAVITAAVNGRLGSIN
ncbi:hypothetical protein GCM10009616_34290 [Microlunatus lacustris]